MVERNHRFGRLIFDRNDIVRAALRAYVEATFAKDPLYRFSFPPCASSRWRGDLRQGSFDNYDGEGSNDVVAWTETGVVGLAYELGFGPIEQLGLSKDAATGGPDDVRGALPGLPPELESALVMATRLLDTGHHGEINAGIGFWLYGDQVAGTLFDNPTDPGVKHLVRWGLLQDGRLRSLSSFSRDPGTREAVAYCLRNQAPLHAIIDNVVTRALQGPTEFTPDELATLLPTPPDEEALLFAQRKLQKVGITWPGSPELPPMPPPGLNPFTGKPFTEADLERSLL
jgi:hypothetical protein